MSAAKVNYEQLRNSMKQLVKQNRDEYRQFCIERGLTSRNN